MEVGLDGLADRGGGSVDLTDETPCIFLVSSPRHVFKRSSAYLSIGPPPSNGSRPD